MINRIGGVEIKATGIMDSAVRFVIENQLKRRDTWQKAVEVYGTREDVLDGRWRGEYFGKQMRGAALICEYTQDQELYEILTDTVKDLLTKQDEYGRFSTYTAEDEFRGWDMWCRKYVLVGMLYYLRICKDEALRATIIEACKKHLDYILSKIGKEDGKIAITSTSHWWGCVNSCTILEPTVEVYKLTGEKRYLDFAEYIISLGGSNDCDLVDLALNSELYPYQYPVTKAYEMMSFYEGLLAYYEVTGEKKCFDAVVRFMDLVEKSDVTIIGCSGCTHELFDNSAMMQTEYHENIMQETCVTVTWMRVNRRLFELTGEAKYMNRFEISGYNALYGSLNTEMNEQLSMEKNEYMEAGAFDSYSPLYMNTRGRGIGGYCTFASGGYNGCCLAIGACGIALMPLSAVMQNDEKVFVNLMFNGDAVVKDKSGKSVNLSFQSNYPANGNGKITVKDDCTLALYIRNPKWCENMMVNGNVITGDYCVLDKHFNAGESIEVCMQMVVKMHVLKGKTAFTYGPLTLASDEQKCQRELKKPIILENGFACKEGRTEKGELVRFECDFGDSDVLILADYQSCGKKWLSDKPYMTVWFNGSQED